MHGCTPQCIPLRPAPQAVAALEGKLASTGHELASTRAQLQEALTAQAAAVRAAESASHEAAQRGAAADRL